jgi:hypothetical protein
MGILHMRPDKPVYISDDICTIVQIDNPSLKAAQVHVELIEKNDEQHLIQIDSKTINIGRQRYLYYEGKKNYRTQVNQENGTLYIGGPIDAGEDTNLKLQIQLPGIEKVFLNGTEIWTN